jgi:isoleucyl-tRNA synthetase
MSVRSVVNACLEVERREKRLGKALEASPVVYVADPKVADALHDVPLGEVFGTSGALLVVGNAVAGAFVSEAMSGVAVEFQRASGSRCARSWMITKDVGSDPEYPDVSARDAVALRELEKLT